MEIKDLAGLSEPVKTLIQEVSKGIGRIYEPSLLKKLATVEAETMVIHAEAEAKAANIKAKSDQDIRIREWQITERLKYLEERRQQNLNKIVELTIQQLPEKINRTNSVDEDWISQFFNFSQDIGNEEIQCLWAKVLAGEVAKPGSFSLRTLDILRLMQQTDAREFNTLRSFLCTEGNNNCLIRYKNIEETLEKFGIGLLDLYNLESIGLINCSADTKITPDEDDVGILHYGDHQIQFRNVTDEKRMVGIYIYVLTSAGNEIVKLCDFQFIQEYFEKSVSYIRDTGYEVSDTH
jgi:hypothetical protein